MSAWANPRGPTSCGCCATSAWSPLPGRARRRSTRCTTSTLPCCSMRRCTTASTCGSAAGTSQAGMVQQPADLPWPIDAWSRAPVDWPWPRAARGEARKAVVVKESFATVLETVADVRADRIAVTHGDRSRTWQQLDERASRLATVLAGHDVGRESRVAIALYNGIEYVESVLAVLKVRAIPVNVNYRYQAQELQYLLGDARVDAIIFDASLGPRVAVARQGAPALRTLIEVGDGSPSGDNLDYAAAIDEADPLPRAARGVDHWLTYTGGTTGQPKGVLVTHERLYFIVSGNGFVLVGEPVPLSLAELRAATRRLTERGDAIVCLPAPPLMHATGMYTTLGALLASGRVAFLTGRSYDAHE